MSHLGFALGFMQWYAVVCAGTYAGNTPDEAMAACRAEQKKDPVLAGPLCACDRNAQVVEIRTSEKPAFFMATCTSSKGATREQAIQGCRAAKLRDNRRADGCDCAKYVTPIYGPFQRKRTPGSRSGFDDERVFRWVNLKNGWVSETGEATCLVAGTPVLTPKGERAIETLAVGDWVTSFGEGGVMPARVTRVKRRTAHEVYEIVLGDGKRIELTGNHPMFSGEAWTRAEQLDVGDAVETLAGAARVSVPIVSKRLVTKEVEVYDLTVTPTHSYFAAGVWVHNY